MKMPKNAAAGLGPMYRPDIDGLRAIAVVIVVLFHAFPKLCCGGFVGVDIFFVISGFLITTIIIKELTIGTFSTLHFYQRRVKRICPALLLVLGATAVFGWLFLAPNEFKQLGYHLLAGSSFFPTYSFGTKPDILTEQQN